MKTAHSLFRSSFWKLHKMPLLTTSGDQHLVAEPCLAARNSGKCGLYSRPTLCQAKEQSSILRTSRIMDIRGQLVVSASESILTVIQS